MLEVLINFHFCDEIPVILDHVLAVLGEFFHERYLFQETAVLVVVLYLYLFQGVQLTLDYCRIDMGVAPAQLLLYLDLLQIVVPLYQLVVRKKVIHR